MKLFQTIDSTFQFLAYAHEAEGNYIFRFVDSIGNMHSIGFTEENFLEQFPATEREKTDSMNIFIVVTPEGIRLVNKYAESYYSQAPGGIFGRVLGYPTVGQIYIPFSDSPISDWAARLNSITTVNPVGNFELVEELIPNSVVGFGDVASQVLPNLRVLDLTPHSDGTLRCRVQLTFNGQDLQKSGIDIRAEADSGYIAIRQLATDQYGRVEFIFRRLDLEPSDEMIVHLGFKLRTRVIEVSVPA